MKLNYVEYLGLDQISEQLHTFCSRSCIQVTFLSDNVQSSVAFTRYRWNPAKSSQGHGLGHVSIQSHRLLQHRQRAVHGLTHLAGTSKLSKIPTKNSELLENHQSLQPKTEAATINRCNHLCKVLDKPIFKSHEDLNSHEESSWLAGRSSPPHSPCSSYAQQWHLLHSWHQAAVGEAPNHAGNSYRADNPWTYWRGNANILYNLYLSSLVVVMLST